MDTIGGSKTRYFGTESVYCTQAADLPQSCFEIDPDMVDYALLKTIFLNVSFIMGALAE
jgi:hypothetical protein